MTRFTGTAYGTEHEVLLHRTAIAAADLEKGLGYLTQARELDRVHQLGEYITARLRDGLKIRERLACALGACRLETLQIANLALLLCLA